MPVHNFEFSERLRSSGLVRQFGLIRAEVSQDSVTNALVERKNRLANEIEANADAIQRAIQSFVTLFGTFGYECPLPSQLKSTKQRGLPKINPPIEALLYCEMTTGVLMGVQDGEKFVGDVIYDVAEAGEQFPGFRGTIVCRARELVVRDEEGIVASVLQGPDKRTSVTPTTRELVFYVFDAPDLPAASFDGGIDAVTALLTDCGGAPQVVRKSVA